MRLSQQTEWMVIGVLILYIAFMPSLPVVGNLVGSPVGKAVALAGVVYAWKYVSAPVSLLLLVSVLRTGEIREHFTGNCPTGYTPDEVTRQCKNSTGQSIAPVICQASQTWDQMTGTCKTADAPSMPPSPSMPPGAGGPPGGPTGAAAAQMALNAIPAGAASSGDVAATSGSSTSSTAAPVSQ